MHYSYHIVCDLLTQMAFCKTIKVSCIETKGLRDADSAMEDFPRKFNEKLQRCLALGSGCPHCSFSQRLKGALGMSSLDVDAESCNDS